MSLNTSQARGAMAENLAASYLQSLGYNVLARNYRSRRGELDLVCLNDGILIFVEVKARWSVSFGSGSEAVTSRKMQKIRHMALEYLDQHPVRHREIRFDVISVLWHDGERQSLDHIQAAF